MRLKALYLAVSAALLAGMTATVCADDGSNGEAGKPILKSMSNIQEATVPDYLDEAEHAFIGMMKFYVPMQAASGATDGVTIDDKTVTLNYYDIEGTLVEPRDLAKPLVGVFMYGPFEEVEGVGFVGHGRREAYGAVSLDDGVTWKETNLSESADLTSCDSSNCDIQREDIPLFAETEYDYPGDVINMFHSIAGNKVLVAWPSRYCASGEPNYSLDNPEASEDQIARRNAIAAYLGIDLATASPDDLYLVDMYAVGGSQGFVDYAVEDDFEPNQAVGAVPYSCLWTARGVLNAGDDPRTEDVVEGTYMRWFKAERLTSGVRDVNRIETVCVSGAGCAITWQEDPEGLRGGQGEGPGEGWSGAVANSGTDVWYSYIDWERFDVVQDPEDDTGATPMELADYELAAVDDITQKPKPFVPFAMPMRLTDNAKCNVANPQPYCIGEGNLANAAEEDPIPADYGLKDLCAAVIQIPTGPQNEPSDICVTADGLPLVGNTAATRPRLGLYGYESDGGLAVPETAEIDSAFAVVVLEEDKGLGAFGFLEDGTTPCDPKVNTETCFAFDSGKNIKYFSFSMSIMDTVGRNAQDGLLANLTFPGHQLNQPEVDWTSGEFYPVANTATMWGFGDYDYDIYNTEIARRGSLLAQDIYKVAKATSKNKAKDGLLALPSWKQGIMNQGGPADVMVRRIVVEKGKWKLSTDGNPYAFRNMACEEWAYDDGSNPYYPGGLCLDSAINLSAVVPDTCQDSETGEPLETCPQVDLSTGSTFGTTLTNPILQGNTVEPNKTKVLTWHACPAEFTNVSATDGTTVVEDICDHDLRTDDSTLLDQSWYNPLDVAKGHRGFLDGDFVMMLYAWSPNWRLNAVGNDRYELYIRRSFDGGLTWTTLPKGFTTWDGVKYVGDGTVTCETFRSDQTQASGDLVEPRVCNSYVDGAAEQPRNVTQHQSMRITTLDPRYAMTGAPQGVSVTSDLLGFGLGGYTSPDGDDEDVRDPSRYFVVYETGDNTTAAEGEPEPLDLFYSRAINFGDDYVVWADDDVEDDCYPSNPHDDVDEDTGVPAELIDSGFCNEFDQMEQGTPGLEASEASLTANPGGQFLYGAWAQIQHDVDTGEAVESDAMARRIWWLDGFTSETYDWTFGQGSGD